MWHSLAICCLEICDTLLNLLFWNMWHLPLSAAFTNVTLISWLLWNTLQSPFIGCFEISDTLPNAAALTFDDALKNVTPFFALLLWNIWHFLFICCLKNVTLSLYLLLLTVLFSLRICFSSLSLALDLCFDSLLFSAALNSVTSIYLLLWNMWNSLFICCFESIPQVGVACTK